ncbi:MAG: hypothetical protein KGV56_05415 [Gammaproteobacteria bacterium]|nr:hypothetical protein [Gammaproteobacteria bacterium]
MFKLIDINSHLENLPNRGKTAILALIDTKMSNDMDKVLTKLDAMESKFDARLDAMESKFDARLDAMESKFDARLDAMESKFDARLDAMESKFDAKFEATDKRFIALESSIKGIRWWIGSSIAAFGSLSGLVIYFITHIPK